ncbi:hypothetical protein L1987_25035 [Smallanthus sonchifolius]|uniref:Uncharacterized protein n=1 Tax=Smallanthus sonchifolius TaxID=185202 RepID=A0ACB9IN14_9ASTR|nr:hypothetical protein L1987_25035 [Smallanthus sonchifolius]
MHSNLAGDLKKKVDSTTVPPIQVSDLMALHAKLGKCLGSFEVGNGGEFKLMDYFSPLADYELWDVDVFSFGIATWEILTEEPYADMHCGAIIAYHPRPMCWSHDGLRWPDEQKSFSLPVRLR